MLKAIKKNDHHFEAELHRLKGECLIALCRQDEAEVCFDRALTVSREIAGVAGSDQYGEVMAWARQAGWG